MNGKKPVYNGYNEQYINGAELKAKFKDCYYGTARHHSVILGITIPDYLDLLNIDDAEEYRIFINDALCRVMDGENDRLISFFSHTPVEKIRFSLDPSKVNLPMNCPECGEPLRFKEGRYGAFLGCSNYPKCKYTAKIPIIGNYSSPDFTITNHLQNTKK